MLFIYKNMLPVKWYIRYLIYLAFRKISGYQFQIQHNTPPEQFLYYLKLFLKFSADILLRRLDRIFPAKAGITEAGVPAEHIGETLNR